MPFDPRKAIVVTGLLVAVLPAVPGCDGVEASTESAVSEGQSSLRRAIDPAKELVITDFSVIESPLETTFDPAHPGGPDPHGAWSFGRLVHDMLPRADRGDPAAASRFVFAWLSSWERDQQPNPAVTLAAKRSRIRADVIDPWKASSGCTGDDASCVLDLARAPFRLIAIAYRPDLRALSTPTSRGIGGEGRFVFELLDAAGKPVKGTVIFEYTLPIRSNRDVVDWAARWHALGDLPFGPAFNAHLRGITQDFAGPDADRERPNGNALHQLRTNEVALKHRAGCDPSGAVLSTGLCAPAESTAAPTQKLWELRQFELTEAGLVPVPVAQEPSRDFDVVARRDGTFVSGSGARSNELARWLVENTAAVRAGTHRIPEAWRANSAVVGSGVPAWGTLGTATAAPKQFVWTRADGSTELVPEDVRAAYAINTCGGCHRHEVSPATGAPPTQTFLHLTDARALDPAEANDQPFRVAPGASDEARRATLLSPFLAAEIAPGGPRYADFEQLLATAPWALSEFKGLRACASPRPE